MNKHMEMLWIFTQKYEIMIVEYWLMKKCSKNKFVVEVKKKILI